MSEKCIDQWITVMWGGAGYFAAHMGMFEDDELGKYPDVIQTGFGRFKSSEEAVAEAQYWAEADELPLKGV